MAAPYTDMEPPDATKPNELRVSHLSELESSTSLRDWSAVGPTGDLFFILESVDSLDLLNSESIAYALDVGVMFLLLAVLALLVVKEEQRVVPTEVIVACIQSCCGDSGG